jgi:hypothetical protein
MVLVHNMVLGNILCPKSLYRDPSILAHSLCRSQTLVHILECWDLHILALGILRSILLLCLFSAQDLLVLFCRHLAYFFTSLFI